MKLLKSIYFILKIILGILILVRFLSALLYPQIMRIEYYGLSVSRLLLEVGMLILVSILIIRIQLGIKFKKQEIIMLASVFALAIFSSVIVFLTSYWKVF